MEKLELRRISCNRKTGLAGTFQPWHVVVIVDATTDLSLTALRFALENFVRPADNLSLLGVLHPFDCSEDDKQKEDRGPKFDGNVMNVTKTIWEKHAQFHKCLTDKAIYQLVHSKKVIFDIKIATGPNRKLVMARQAVDLRASWVILEEDLREDKAYLMQRLNCNVVLMKSRTEAAIIKLELPDAENPHVREWKNRWATAVGTARAIRYLHEECGIRCTVHRDSKNIPVEFDAVPVVILQHRRKLNSFGTSSPNVTCGSCGSLDWLQIEEFLSASSSQQSSDDGKETRCMAMSGYLAPEYAEYGSITDKADIYSFGVLLLQLISGRKAIDDRRADGQKSVTEWARPLIQAGKKLDIVDPCLRHFCDVDQATKIVDVVTRCISTDPSQRPNILEVLSILEHDGDFVSSISLGSSANDVTDILHDPATKCLLQTNLITSQPGGFTEKSSTGKEVASSIGTEHPGFQSDHYLGTSQPGRLTKKSSTGKGVASRNGTEHPGSQSDRCLGTSQPGPLTKKSSTGKGVASRNGTENPGSQSDRYLGTSQPGGLSKKSSTGKEVASSNGTEHLGSQSNRNLGTSQPEGLNKKSSTGTGVASTNGTEHSGSQRQSTPGRLWNSLIRSKIASTGRGPQLKVSPDRDSRKSSKNTSRGVRSHKRLSYREMV